MADILDWQNKETNAMLDYMNVKELCGAHIGLVKQRNGRLIEPHYCGRIMRRRHGGRIGLVKQRNGRHI